MAKQFFVRVQLRDANPDDKGYKPPLDSEMAKRGFDATILVGGKPHNLPVGSYVGTEDKTGGTREEALKRTKEAVDATGRKASIFVVETEQVLEGDSLEPTHAEAADAAGASKDLTNPNATDPNATGPKEKTDAKEKV
jgi:hypothetical protein